MKKERDDCFFYTLKCKIKCRFLPLFFFFCLSPCFLLGAQEKLLTINKTNASLEQIIWELKKTTHLKFMYSNADVEQVKGITIKENQISVEEVLKRCLNNTNLGFEKVDDTIVIREKGNVPQTEKLITVTGTVKDKEGKPIPGVTVLLKGTIKGTTTNEKGEFLIKVDEGSILEFSFIGFKKITKKITKQDTTLKIVLEEDQLELSEVVVNGYFSRSKESLTGSAVIVNSSELEKVTSGNVITALQIFDPSFRISDNIEMGSNPNVLPDFRIRGNSGLGTISEGNLKGSPNLPTFILDGYEVSVEKIYDIDMNRIESITILKDASATAIYGSRAANGVVVLVTKTPKEGKLRVNYNFQGTVNAPDLSDYNLLNAEDKLKVEVLAGRYRFNDSDVSAEVASKDYEDYCNRERNVLDGVNTYWLSKPLQVSFGQKHSLLVEGGDAAVRYSVDASYQGNPGVMKNSSRDRYSLGFKLQYNYHDKLLFRNNLSIGKVKAQESNYGDFSIFAMANPYQRIHDENGNLIDIYKTAHVVSSSYIERNPLYQSTLHNVDKNQQTDWSNNFDFDWRITENFRLRTRLAYSESFQDSYYFESPKNVKYLTPEYTRDKPFERGYAKKTHLKSSNLDVNTVFSFNKTLHEHSINVVLGGNIIENKTENDGYEVHGFSNEYLDDPSFAYEFANQTPIGSEGTTRLAGVFMNLNYDYKMKYLLDFSYRIDGSSIYGSEKRSSPFYSVGLGWNIHNEPFFKKMSSLNYLKISGNIGTSGKASFSPYEAQTSFNYYRGVSYAGMIGASLMAFGNSSLKWEKTFLKDIRLEIGLFNNFIFITGNYYRKDTKDLLTDVSLPTSTGFTSYKNNIGALKNEGYEINLRTFIVRREEFNINVYGMLVHNKNVITKISNSLKSYNDDVDKEMNTNNTGKSVKVKFIENQSTTTIYAMKSLGINPANGKELFVDKEGNLTYQWDASQQIAFGDTEPKISGTLGANIDYKGFNVNCNFLYELGGKLYNQTLVDKVENANIRYNVDKRVLKDRWSTVGQSAKFKSIRDDSETKVTSRFVEDNNLLRLQSVSVSYTFDLKKLKEVGIERLKAGFLMNDVFRLSTIKQERGISYPFARSFTFNVQVQF